MRRIPVIALGILALAVLAAAAPPPAGAALTGAAPSTWFVDMGSFDRGAHASLTCQSCHPEHVKAGTMGSTFKHPDIESPKYLKAPVRREYNYHLCAECHRAAWDRYAEGAHAEVMRKQAAEPPAKGASLAPTCADCHNPHYDAGGRDRLAMGRMQVRVCGSCHQAQALTYLETYHGKAAINLGHPTAAHCADCHGAHRVRSLKDPQAALAACRRCHIKAPPKFAQMVMHPTKANLDPKQDGDKIWRVELILTVSMIMFVIVLVVVGAYYGHNFLWLLRELHHKIRGHGHDQ